jgi:hypothetical protein
LKLLKGNRLGAVWRAWILLGRRGNAPARLRLCHAGQHQLGGRDSGWREGEQALVFWPGALLLQPADTVPGA